MFWRNMKATMLEISNSSDDEIILYLDKIVYPDSLEPILEKLNMAKPKNCELKFVAFVPTPADCYSINGEKYPFSLSLLFDCIVRVVNRTDHATL